LSYSLQKTPDPNKSVYHYIRDRVCGAYEMPALATLITERAKEINLGASWNSS